MPWTRDHDARCLAAAIARDDADFDPAASLLRRRSGSTYHSKLTGQLVHPLRDSAAYALALLDAGDDSRIPRAEALLDAVLGHQETDPEAKTYGIWPYYAEEPLAQMAPPDWNWADFLGERLYGVLARHRSRIDRELASRVATAQRHACESIRRRNVGPGYTNICALGTFVTLATAELFVDADLLLYALERLQNFAADTARRGSFMEYNSPTYTIVTIGALTKLAAVAQHELAVKLLGGLLATAWRQVTDHWHAPTQQWAGPHARCYHTDLRGYHHPRLVLQKASGGRLRFYELDELPGDADVATEPFHKFAAIPDQILSLTAPRTHEEIYDPGAKLIATTYLHPEYTLGTFDRCTLWNQRRPLLAYFGGPSGAYLQFQALHDGRDFASAQVFCDQRAGQAIAAVNFANDGGDWHPSLDTITGGRFRAADLRLRLRFGNVDAADAPASPPLGELAKANVAGAIIHAGYLAGKCGEEPVAVEVTPLEDGFGIDLVLWHRDAVEWVVWKDLAEVWAALAVSFDGPLAAFCEVTAGEVRVRAEGLGVKAAAAVQKGGVQQQQGGRVKE